MKILFFKWNSFMNPGIVQALQNLHIPYETYEYDFKDWNQDEKFMEQFDQYMDQTDIQMVLSIDYSPLIAQICYDRKLPYVAWIYDSPINIESEKELGYPTSYLFCFDRGQAQEYEKRGIRALHLPLAASPKLFLKDKITMNDRKKYRSQVSMVGQLYTTDFEYYNQPLDQYQRGYLSGVLNAQSKIYGAYLFSEIISDEFLDGMNKRYMEASDGKITLNRRQLEYMLASEVTARERYIAMAVLSNHFQVKHYADTSDKRLERVEFMGYADYYTEMPKIFQLTDVNLNISLRSIRTGIPLRCLDVMACGGFLISNYQEELAEYFRLGEEVVTYGDLEELVYLTDYYLREDALRKKIAKCGQDRIKADFTYEKGLKKIFKETLGVAV